MWHTNYAWPSYTAVQMNYYTLISVHLCHDSWRHPGLSRGLESKLILINESTSNVTRLNCTDHSQGLELPKTKRQPKKEIAIRFLDPALYKAENRNKACPVKKQFIESCLWNISVTEHQKFRRSEAEILGKLNLKKVFLLGTLQKLKFYIFLIYESCPTLQLNYLQK